MKVAAGRIPRGCNAKFFGMLCSIVLILSVVGLARGADWPQYRGINRDGNSAETGWLKTWPPTEVWRQPVGRAWSSMAVSDGRVYTMGWSTNTDFVYCFDAYNGTPIWTYSYPMGHVGQGGPGATPTVDGNNVYTYSLAGDLHCFNKVTGALVWYQSVNLGGGAEWGLNGSPLVDGNLVILNTGGGTAVDKNTGTNILHAGSGGGFGSPKAITINSQRIIIQDGSPFPWAYCIDEATWTVMPSAWNWAGGMSEDAEFYGTNMFYGKGSLQQFSSSGITTLWNNPSFSKCPYSASVIGGDYAYGYTGNGCNLTCQSLTNNGVIMWSQLMGPNSANDYEGAVIYSDGKLICLNGDQRLFVLTNPSVSFNTNTYAPYQMTFEDGGGSGCRANPVLANGLMYCRDFATMYTGGFVCTGNLVCLNFGAGGAVTNYTINANTGPNGSILPSGSVLVALGSSQAFTISPNASCSITNVVVDGSSVGVSNSYTFVNVQTNHTISAYFSASSITNFTITAGAGANGSITPSGIVTVKPGSNQTFTISGNSGYVVTNVVVDGGSVGVVSSYPFNNVLTNHTISAYFGSTSTNYTINASAGANGSITPSGTLIIPYGNSQSFTIAVNSGYNIANVLVDGSSVGAPSSYSFNNVQANHTISVTFSGSGPSGFNAWANSMTVTFSGYNKAETLTNFPALVVLNSSIPGFSYGQFASTNGYDLRFSADGSTELNYEIEQWNPSGNSYVWVQVPQLSSSSYIWAYWNNAGAASGPAAYTVNGATWPTNAFAGVWHMGKTNSLDSTANGNSGIGQGSITNATGIVDGAQGETGGGYVWIVDSSSLEFATSAATISGWVRFNTLPSGNGNEQAITRKGNQWALEAIVDGSTLEMRNLIHTSSANGWTVNNDDVFNPALSVGQWYYFAFTYSGAQLCNFENGTQIGAHAVSGTVSLTGNPLGLGASAGGSGDNTGQYSLANAIMDEVRVEQVFRSPNWIWATYLTVASNASFSVCGSVQSGGSSNNIPPATWIQQYYPGMPATNYANLAGTVGCNGMTVWQSYLAGANPTNANSCLRALIAVSNGNILVTYQTGPAVYSNMSRYYEVDSVTDLFNGTWQPVPGATNVPGNNGAETYTNSSPNGRIYYRIKARLQ